MLRSMFCSVGAPFDHFPKLKCKAAEAKHLVAATVPVWEHFMDRNSQAKNTRVILLALHLLTCPCAGGSTDLSGFAL